MLINLLEIPEEGKSFVCNQNTGDLNDSLKDLIGKTPYWAEFTIKPLQAGTFELVGSIKTELPEACSLCGLDFCLKVNEKFKEMLIPEQPNERNARYSRANHYSDMSGEGPSVAEYQGHVFNVGEYIHEVIALAEPTNPVPEATPKGDCSVCKEPFSNQPRTYEDKDFEKPESPFAVLKNIKLS